MKHIGDEGAFRHEPTCGTLWASKSHYAAPRHRLLFGECWPEYPRDTTLRYTELASGKFKNFWKD